MISIKDNTNRRKVGNRQINNRIADKKRLDTNKSFAVVLINIIVVFIALYAPQPLLPFISNEFGVSATTSAWLLSIPFIFLCFSPIVFGAMLSSVSARKVLIVSVLLLSGTQLIFAFANEFHWLIISRVVQAILYPAIFTASVTYCSKAGLANKIEHRVSLYIASTIFGGLLGRILSGFVTSAFGWPTIFMLTAAALLLCAIALHYISADKITSSTTTNTKMMRNILKDRTILSGYIFVFTTFFAFSATLTALPFRLVEIQPDITAAKISLVYLGYVLGFIIATNNQKLCQLAGGRVMAMTIALALLLAGIILLFPGNFLWLVAVSFITAAGMFLIHSTLSGFLTSLMPAQASLINGLYISIYYAAGALGSLLPLWIYNHSGWYAFLFSIFCVAALGLITLSRLAVHSNRRKNQD